MASSVEQIQSDIQAASVPGFRGRLLARGQARAMIWRDGVLPPGAPEFSPLLSYDLHSYGYALLGLGLRLLELEGDRAIARVAFEQAAEALESVISNGDPADSARSFHHVMAGAAYHLGRFSARAFSLLARIAGDDDFSPIETALSHLMLRQLDDLNALALSIRLDEAGSDQSLRAALEQEWEAIPEDGPAEGDETPFYLDAVDRALTDNFFAGMSAFLLAVESGEQALVEQAKAILREGLGVCAELNLVPQWWGHRVAIHLIDDLWASSFHANLPLAPVGGDAPEWESLRRRFLAVLVRRSRGEIDLWPSQQEACGRSVDQADDLVVSLPTSAGKTRIAELCILRCLAANKRVVYVTPLRALSAQTEATLQRTFAPLGKTVSALYGSIGVSGFDEDALRERDIVVTTPEKFDFALRNDPSLLDDVGLVVLDEGHMIGLGEREVRYEVQIQRLLRRADADQRRIVCLSAILPDGPQLDDFVAWLRRDKPGGLVRHDWRPTRLRYGEVVWRRNAARLNLRVGDERPFVPQFLVGRVPPIGERKKVFPKDLGELCLATAWRLVSDGQSVLIFCPVRRNVEPFARRILDLHARGVLPSLMTADQGVIQTAMTLGAEWLGADHPILSCLKLGVAIHHGALPTAFRKEVEALLREGVLKVTISSPTLAQGLNLSATAVIFHSLSRNRERIKGPEFKNVVGRAGRAYVDVEGLVLYPIFDKHAKRLKDWEELIGELGTREMESGLLKLVITLLQRIQNKLKIPLDQLSEYVLNNAEAWTFPELPGEKEEVRQAEQARWAGFLASLDTAILSLLGEEEIAEDQLEVVLDDVLGSSLWERRINRRDEQRRNAIKSGLLGRASVVWANSTPRQRRGYFLAGVGLGTGHALDAIAAGANDLLIQANGAILNNDVEAAVAAITALAEQVFQIVPFSPEILPDNWREILQHWLMGQPMAGASAEQKNEALKFVEDGLVYRLPWAMEALRVRGIANGDEVGDGMTLEDFELGLAVAAVETGTLKRAGAILIQAGFTSRLAAIKAIDDTVATFETGRELREWLESDAVRNLTAQGDWPTPETAAIWKSFRETFSPQESVEWTEQNYPNPLDWIRDPGPAAGEFVRVAMHPVSDEPVVVSSTGELLGLLGAPLNPDHRGLAVGRVADNLRGIRISYVGPNDLWDW